MCEEVNQGSNLTKVMYYFPSRLDLQDRVLRCTNEDPMFTGDTGTWIYVSIRALEPYLNLRNYPQKPFDNKRNSTTKPKVQESRTSPYKIKMKKKKRKKKTNK